MARWILALVLSSGIVLFGVPQARHRAFRAGWFERGRQTRRRRSERRPTHGGVVLGLALLVGAALTGPGEPACLAVAAVVVIAIVSGVAAERGEGPAWWVAAGRVAVAAVVPLLGVRAELTGSAAIDVVLTALAILALLRGMLAVERSDATMPFAVGIAATAFLVIATRTDDPIAPMAAAVIGATLGMVAHAWPPAAVRIGAIGPTVLAGSLAVVAIELQPQRDAATAMVVPLLALATLGMGALVPEWDRRLRTRLISSHLLIPLAGTAGALAATRFSAGTLELVSAVVLAFGPPAILAVIAWCSPPPRAEDWTPHRARNATIALLVFGAVGLVAVVSALNLWSARRDMHRGREFATSGLEAARDGELEEAQRLFATADAAFADAAGRLGNPLVRVGDVVPGIAQNLRSARTLADVGQDLSGTAVAVAERAGADDLQVIDGRFPVDTAEAVSAELGPALDTLREASARLAAIDGRLLVEEVREGNVAVAERVADATESIEVAAEATRLAPSLLGADGDRRWMLAVLTPSEQRGAGGLAGDYAELRASDGDVELVESLPASDLNATSDPVEQAQALPAIYRDRYEGFRVGRFWQNLSATPHVPSFAEAIASAYPLTEGGGPVDGVVTIDPHGIAALLELTGPVDVYPWPTSITSENVARILLYGHYNGLREDLIDEFQGDVVDTIVDRLTSGPLPSVAEMAATLGPAVTGGHIRVWSSDEDAQALFERVGADGSLGTRPAGTDFIQLVTQNAGENKIDFFMRRTLVYEATVNPRTGSVRATATVTILNTAPNRGVSDYVIGEADGPTAPGENELEVTLLSPHELVSVTDDRGNHLPVNRARERGLEAVTVFLQIPSRQQATIVVTYDGDLEPTDGSYELTVARQPAVVPDRIEARVVGALGWSRPGLDVAEVVSEDDQAVHLSTRFVR